MTSLLLIIPALALSLGPDPSAAWQQGTAQGIYQRESIQAIERNLAKYLNDEEIQSVLTPGEFVEWKLDMKAGQVLFGEAQSSAFDPGLEVVDDSGKTLANNDDRYPGDQRPLVLWRCPANGTYFLRVRSFRDKSGGQVDVRFEAYHSMDVVGDVMTEGIFAATQPFLVRIPMKAGQIKDLVAEKRGDGNYINFNFDVVISPTGLPERSPSLATPISPAIRALIAPVDGDYYLLAVPYGYGGGNGRVRIGTRDFAPRMITLAGSSATVMAPGNRPALFEVNVKKGDLLEASTAELNLNSAFRVSEAIDFSKFDVAKPETNPFFPILRAQPPQQEPALDFLPARSRDGRVAVFQARRDARLWLATDGAGPGKEYTLAIKPAASSLVEDKSNVGHLKVAKVDYWAFDAQAGDVMSFSSVTTGFNPVVVVREPGLGEIRHAEAALDQTADQWRMTLQKPGSYLVKVSCLGDGGGGQYTLTRKVFRPQEFSMATPAKGEISEGQTQIWKFTATPNNPLLIRWNSSAWNYDVAIYNERGEPSGFQRQTVDEHNQYGLLKVDQPQTFIVVLTGGKAKASYAIELNKVPGR
jgi:hypothetical protein